MGDHIGTGTPQFPKRVSIAVPVPDENHEESVHTNPSDNQTKTPKKKKAPLFGLLEFVTLKILFVDLLVSVGDVGSDFGFSWQLYEKSIEEKDDLLFKYAAIVFSINWFPGLVAAIHVLSMYRKKEGQSPQAILVYALLMLVFYPVVPVLGYLVLLYCRPKVRMCHYS